ncbi:unnamed protein product [Alopecurus aequalis]
MGTKLPASVPLSQVAKLGSLLLLFLLAPLVPSFLRVPYFYFLFNVIVLGLGIQAGFLGGGGAMTASSTPRADEIRHRSSCDQAVAPISYAASPFQGATSVQPNFVDQTALAENHAVSIFGTSSIIELKTKTKTVVLTLMKKCPSTASLFFLSALNGGQVGGEGQLYEEENEDCNKVDVDGDVIMSRQELFANTERFIGRFHKQLRMQRQ